MELQFTQFDWLLIAAYFILLVLLSLRKNWISVDEESYLLSGRKVTLPAFVATLVSTWYGGILGVGEYSYQYGISQWLIFAFPFYVFSILFAVYLAGKIRENKALTIPEAISNKYGSKPGAISSIAVFVLVSPAPYILMLGLLIQFMLGGSDHFMIYAILVALFSVAYVSFGGFKAVVRTDILQMILMFLGFFILAYFAVQAYGSPLVLWQELPEFYKDITGGHSIQYILVWFFIAMWTFVDPGFHQRAAAAKTPAIARKGIFMSVFCWFIFDFFTLLTGLYGVVMMADIDNPILIYPYLANVILPVGFKGLFFLTLIATIMSTMDSFLFLSGQTLGRDLMAKSFTAVSSVNLTRLCIFISTVLAILLIYIYPSVIALWYVIGSVMIPGLLIPVLGVYIRFFSLHRAYASYALVIPILVSLIWLIAGSITSDDLYSQSFLGIEPFYPGLLSGGLIWAMGRNVKPKINEKV
ncbi:MAG: sodium:solute symporter family protein [Balneolales bacterium]